MVRITKDNEALFVSDAPSLRDYRDKAMRTRDSLPARFYRMVMGKEWDGEGHSYSLATTDFRHGRKVVRQVTACRRLKLVAGHGATVAEGDGADDARLGFRTHGGLSQ